MACSGWCNNQECSTHIATCSNSYAYSSTIPGVTIRQYHMTSFQSAVNGAYSRRGMGNPSWSGWPVIVGDDITAARYTVVKTNINALHAALVTEVFTIGNLIYGSYNTALQNDADTVRNECVCDYACSCNINCGCNVDCTCDYSDRRVKNNIIYL
jgi:hypothetical protein